MLGSPNPALARFRLAAYASVGAKVVGLLLVALLLIRLGGG